MTAILCMWSAPPQLSAAFASSLLGHKAALRTPPATDSQSGMPRCTQPARLVVCTSSPATT